MPKHSVCSRAGVILCLVVSALMSRAEGLAVVPDPQSGLLVLPRGEERQTSRMCGRSGGPFDPRTVMGLAWDEQGLMVRIDCTDSSIVAAQGNARDNRAYWKDDAVELLLDPGHRHGVPICIGLTAAGAVTDSRGTDMGFKVEGLVARAVRTPKGWRANLIVPWAGLGVKPPSDGEIWGFNLKRIDQTNAFSFATMQVGSWLPFKTDSQGVLMNGQVAFVLPATLEDDAKLAAMRDSVAAGHEAAVRAWTGPNEGDVLVLGEKPVEIADLGLIGSGVPAREATRVRIARDAEGLDIRFECDDEDVFAVQEGRDTVKMWKDDCVSVWLDIGHKHRIDSAMVEVQLSARGVVRDARNIDATWTLEGLTAETARTDKGWVAHLRLPWKGLGVEAPKDGEVWGLNLARTDQPGAYDYFGMQVSSLSMNAEGNMGAIHRWGHLAFGKGDDVDVAIKPVHASQFAVVEQQLASLAAERKANEARNAARWGMPANPNASESARKVLKGLAGLTQRKDKRLILCQENWSYEGGNAGGFKAYVGKLAEKSGKWIGMIHVSYGNATPSDSADPSYRSYLKDANQNAILYSKAGGLVTVHINPANPITGKTGSESLQERERIAEVCTPGTEAYKNWRKKLDEYAVLLTELRDAGVVVLWRPLHEMTFKNCYWYDAGATKDREVYKEIWRQMFRYYSEEKKLDNLLWVYSVTGLDGSVLGGARADEMYPGSEYVDIVGLSQYSDDVDITGNVYETLTSLGKPFAFSEFGPGHSAGGNLQTAGGLSNMDLVRAVREKYPLTTYACYWGSWTGANMAIIDVPDAVELVNHPWVANRDDLNWK